MYTLTNKITIDCVPDVRRPVINLRDQNDVGNHLDIMKSWTRGEIRGAIALIPIAYISDDERLKVNDHIVGLPNYAPIWLGDRIEEIRPIYRVLDNGVIKNTNEMGFGGFLNPGVEIKLLFGGVQIMESTWNTNAIRHIYGADLQYPTMKAEE